MGLFKVSLPLKLKDCSARTSLCSCAWLWLWPEKKVKRPLNKHWYQQLNMSTVKEIKMALCSLLMLAFLSFETSEKYLQTCYNNSFDHFFFFFNWKWETNLAWFFTGILDLPSIHLESVWGTKDQRGSEEAFQPQRSGD